MPVPKSNTRDQAVFAEGLTQAEIVKSLRPAAMPDGRLTYSLLPHRDSALPILPWTRGPVAVHDAALPPAPSPWSPLVTGSVIEPSEPTGTSPS